MRLPGNVLQRETFFAKNLGKCLASLSEGFWFQQQEGLKC
jgi:hypothetical protein